jgi:hypothetical protein
MFTNKTIIVASLALAAGAAGCRPGRLLKKPLQASQQPHGELKLPQHGDERAPLDLTGTELSVTYDGNLLLWNPKVTPDQIGAISDASVASRVAKAAQREFDLVTLQPEIAAAAAAVTAKEAEIAANAKAVDDTAKAKLNSPEARALKIDAAAKWFDASVAKLEASGALTADGAAASRENFKAYCEYKIYELATSRLIQLNYSERPSPLQMCEGYYRAQGLFSADAEVCKPGRGNYFDCLWAEGVFKSQTYAALASTGGAVCKPTPTATGPNRAAALRAWFDSGLLRKIVFDNDAVGTSTFARVFGDSLTQNKLLLTPNWNKKPEYKDVLACRQVAQRTEVPAVAPDWQHALLTNLKSVAETAAGAAQVFPLFNVSRDTGATDAQVTDVSDTVRKFRQYVERRDGSKVVFDDATTLTDVNVSADDQFFNQPVGATISANPENFEGASNEPDIKRIFDVEAALKPADLLAKGVALDGELADLKAAKDALPHAIDSYDAVTNKASQDGGAALTAPGAVDLARKLTLSIKTQGDKAQVDLSFGGKGLDLRACTDLASGAGFDCGADGLLSLNSLSYDRATGKLAIAIPVADEDALGLGTLARVENATEFSDLTAGALNGRTLELDIYPNRLNPYYEFVTGVARVKDAAGKVEREGSFSADNFGR